MVDFTVQQLTQDDWKIYRDLRLEALTLHPEYFQPTQDEFKFKEEDWKKRLSNPDSATFGVFKGDQLIGITGIFKAPHSSEAHLVSSYIRKDFRQMGLSRLFYEARINWAKARKDISKLIIEHSQDNIPSRKAHQKYGFKYVKTYDETWPDGSTRPCMVYELNLRE